MLPWVEVLVGSCKCLGIHFRPFMISDLHVTLRGGRIMHMYRYSFQTFYDFRPFHGISWSTKCIQTWEVLILDLLLVYLHELGALMAADRSSSPRGCQKRVPLWLEQGSNQNHERSVRINHLPLLRKSAASAFIVSPWKLRGRTACPSRGSLREYMEARFRAKQKQLSKRLSFASLREMRREPPKSSRQWAKAAQGWVMVSPPESIGSNAFEAAWCLCAMANRAERKPRSNRSSTWVWQPAWMIPRLSREVSAFFFARVQKVTVKSQWLWHKKCWHPNWWLECFISKKREQTLCGSFFGYPKVLKPRKVCIDFNYAGILFLTLCVFLKWVW